MTKYLLDTNVVLRFANPSDAKHIIATNAVYNLLLRGDECYLTAQIIIELWVVATRPQEVNGLGWNAERTRYIIDQLLIRFPLVEESSQIFITWLNLGTAHQVTGKRTHDIRLGGVMLANNITHLLTFNPKDFNTITDITIVQPQELLGN